MIAYLLVPRRDDDISLSVGCHQEKKINSKLNLKKTKITIFLILLTNWFFGQEDSRTDKSVYRIGNYNTEELVVKLDKNIELYGTLITPKYKFNKILIIISGTGNISQKAHKYLTKSLLQNNIGVFRFDKRGVGKSTGINKEDHQVYADDFIQIYKQLKKSNSAFNKKIGFLAHSMGGIVSIQAIEENITPDFLIQWSAPIGKPRNLIEYQIRNGIQNYDNFITGKTVKEKANTLRYVHDLIDRNPKKNAWDLWKLAKKESKNYGISKKSFEGYLMPSIVEFAKLDNSTIYKELNIPTLVIIGTEDILIDPIASKKSIEDFNNVNIEFKSFEGLNHFLEENSSLTTKDWNINEDSKKYIIDWIMNN